MKETNSLYGISSMMKVMNSSKAYLMRLENIRQGKHHIDS